jgi:hypothetical protein
MTNQSHEQLTGDAQCDAHLWTRDSPGFEVSATQGVDVS